MSKPIRQRPLALIDFMAIANFLHAVSPDASLKFIAAVESAYALLSEHPASGSTRHAFVVPELPVPLRFHPIAGFPRLLIYYLDLPDAVEVVRLWDAARGLDALIEDSEEPS